MHTAPSPSAVDPAVLHAVATTMGLDLARELVAVYSRSTGERVAAVRAGVADDAPATVRHAAHALTSSAGAVGATVVTDIARALEAQAVAGWQTPPHATAEALEAAVDASHAQLAAVLDDLAAAGLGEPDALDLGDLGDLDDLDLHDTPFGSDISDDMGGDAGGDAAHGGRA